MSSRHALVAACSALLVSFFCPTARADELSRFDLQPHTEQWLKLCKLDTTGKRFCFTYRSFGYRSSDAQFSGKLVVAFALYERAGDTQDKVRFLIPPGSNVNSRVRFGLGGRMLGVATVAHCSDNGCTANARVSKSIVNRLSDGAVMTVEAEESGSATNRLSFPLDGFMAAYRSAGSEFSDVVK